MKSDESELFNIAKSGSDCHLVEVLAREPVVDVIDDHGHTPFLVVPNSSAAKTTFTC
jgi:hypothetical protein